MTTYSPIKTTHAGRVEELRSRVNEKLATVVPETDPPSLYEPARYVLASKGKRIRPVLLLLAADAFGAQVEDALPAAIAIEVFHNFTLVHDDIMDNADTRRGRPTVHVRWDEGTAILVGDLLVARSYDLLSQIDDAYVPDAMQVYNRMVSALCRGQALDKAFEARTQVSVDEYLDMIQCKTGALIEAALELGAVLGDATDSARSDLRQAARHIGRAFQIQDDLLDLTADNEAWGKAVGGDLMEGKKTFLLLRALEQAADQDRAWFDRIMEEGGLPAEDIPEARRRMRDLGVFDEAREEVERHSRLARNHLDVLPASESTETIHWLIDQMQARHH